LSWYVDFKAFLLNKRVHVLVKFHFYYVLLSHTVVKFTTCFWVLWYLVKHFVLCLQWVRFWVSSSGIRRSSLILGWSRISGNNINAWYIKVYTVCDVYIGGPNWNIPWIEWMCLENHFSKSSLRTSHLCLWPQLNLYTDEHNISLTHPFSLHNSTIQFIELKRKIKILSKTTMSLSMFTITSGQYFGLSLPTRTIQI